jgi:hypothetical protein
MSAKPSKKSAKREVPPATRSTPAATPGPAMAATGATGTGAPLATAWIDSSDPRKRMIGKSVLVGVWIYVAALWVLALDQTFHWGIFGPKVPPVP